MIATTTIQQQQNEQSSDDDIILVSSSRFVPANTCSSSSITGNSLSTIIGPSVQYGPSSSIHSKGLVLLPSSSSSSLRTTTTTKRTNNNRQRIITQDRCEKQQQQQQQQQQQRYNNIPSLMLSNVCSIFTVTSSSPLSSSSSSPRSDRVTFCKSSCSNSCGCSSNNGIPKTTTTTTSAATTTTTTMIVMKSSCLLKIVLVVLCFLVVLIQLRESQSITLDLLTTNNNNTPITPPTEVVVVHNDGSTPILATTTSTTNFLRQQQRTTTISSKAQDQQKQQQESVSVLSKIYQYFSYPFSYQPRNTYSYQQHIVGKYNHTIPNVITFTYKYNLLNTTLPFTKDTPNLSKEEREEVALQRNVRDIIATHPESKVRFFTDNDCINSLRNVMNILYNNNTTITETMIQYFRTEPHGMYRGDICRGAALYETGGLYFDVDLGVRYSVWNIIRPDTEFVTINALKNVKENKNGFFQAFIGVTPQHPLIGRYIDLFYQYYQGQLSDVSETTLLGVTFLRRAYDDINLQQQQQHQEEQHAVTTTTNLEQHTQLWDETYYDPKTMGHVPLPNWGDKGLCDVVVVASVDPTAIQLSTSGEYEQQQKQQQQQEYTIDVPIYSRIADSRNCFTSTPYQEWKRKYKRIFNRHFNRIGRLGTIATKYIVGGSSSPSTAVTTTTTTTSTTKTTTTQ